ncbi:MAG: hypothetical protein HOV80_33635 [Polyangiaceae bacterium]|nr:hypothetical protein [Polyangiaceae bacterium]
MSRVAFRIALVASTSFFLMAAKSDGCNADKSIGGNNAESEPESGPVVCGDSACDPGLVCCDATCGACAAEGECPQTPCEMPPTCGATTCGDGSQCCQDTCCIDAAAECGAESCVPAMCGEATCEAGTQFCCDVEGCTKCLANGATCSPQACVEG